MIEEHMQAARNFLNEASNSVSLAEREVEALQKKADALALQAEEHDRVTAKLEAQQSALSAAEAKLAVVNKAHQQFAKLVNG